MPIRWFFFGVPPSVSHVTAQGSNQMTKSQFQPLADIAAAMIDCNELAQASADDEAKGEVIVGQIRDGVNSEITLGHVLVAVFYGNEETIKRVGLVIQGGADATEEIEPS
jgi:hypothetical protein